MYFTKFIYLIGNVIIIKKKYLIIIIKHVCDDYNIIQE